MSKSFQRDVAAFVEHANENAETFMRAAVLELGTEIIRTTPRLTGAAKNSWITTIDREDTASTRNAASNGAGALSNLNAVVAQFGNNRMIMSNNLDYIADLEYGSSNQAPRGMVRVAVKRFKRYLQKAAARLK